jgi:hypothetical protein
MNNANRSQKTRGLLACLALLLTLTAIPKSVAGSSLNDAAQAQLAPNVSNLAVAQTAGSPQADAPASAQAIAERRFPWLWLLLIPPLGGLLVRLLKRSHPILNSAPADAAKDVSINLVPPVDSTISNARSLNIPLNEDFVVANHSGQTADATGEQQVQTNIQLLEERLVVDLHKRKVGEVIVRKEIETRIVEVPICREILIVEQISPEFKQIAVIDLEQADETEVAPGNGFLPTVEAKFTSATAAIQFLKEIAERLAVTGSDRLSETEAAPMDSVLQSVQINIVLKDADAQAVDRYWLKHESTKPTASAA